MPKSRQPEYELVPVGADASFIVREFKLPRFTSPWHIHPEYELTFIVAGRGLRFVGDNVTAFRPGDLVFVGANLPHYWRSAGRRAHSLVVQFREDCLGKDFFQHPELHPIRQLLARARRGLQFTGQVRAAVADRMRHLHRFTGPARVAEFIAILAVLAQTRQARLLCSEGFQAAADFTGSDRVHRACRYVFDHLSGEIRLDDAARAAALSPAAFCRYFKRATGRRFFDFVNDLRIGHACAQLIETDNSVAEIAYAAGFTNLANFNRRFRERHALTPSDYRRRHAIQ
jgi:AraC-like DNA-binding protein/quercetin dioxygenase-like cupin family protein